MRASAVILLLSPEHLTAANIRKRYILSLSNDSSALVDALAAELRLLDSFFCSPLPRHTKSPTLWSHRRWLITSFMAQLCYRPAADGGSPSVTLSSELEVIQSAAVHHPRNYYAFDYLRKLVANILPGLDTVVSGQEEKRGATRAQLATEALTVMQKFCQAHLSDISAWSALLFLLRTAANVDKSFVALMTIIEMAIKYRWKNESVWVFLRTAIAGGVQLSEEQTGELESCLWSYVTDLEEALPPAAHSSHEGSADEFLADRDTATVLGRAKSALGYMSKNATSCAL